MAPSRWVLLAKVGPHLAIFAFLAVAFCLIGAMLLFGEFLTSTQRLGAVGVFMVPIALTYLYQGYFMVFMPERTLEHEIAPPIPVKHSFLRSLYTPSSRLGCRIVGLLTALAGLQLSAFLFIVGWTL